MSPTLNPIGSGYYMYEFTVVGPGTLLFPVDQLRYDMALPSNPDAAALIENAGQNEPGSISTIKLIAFSLRATWRPSVDRWKSFGWSVQGYR